MQRIFQSKLFTVVLVLLVAWLGLSAYRIRLEKDETDEQVSNVQTKIDTLQRENETLANYIEYLKSPEFLARQARLKLNYKAADEQVAYVYPDTKESVSAEPEVQDLGTLAKIKTWFYNLFH